MLHFSHILAINHIATVAACRHLASTWPHPCNVLLAPLTHSHRAIPTRTEGRRRCGGDCDTDDLRRRRLRDLPVGLPCHRHQRPHSAWHHVCSGNYFGPMLASLLFVRLPPHAFISHNGVLGHQRCPCCHPLGLPQTCLMLCYFLCATNGAGGVQRGFCICTFTFFHNSFVSLYISGFISLFCCSFVCVLLACLFAGTKVFLC